MRGSGEKKTDAGGYGSTVDTVRRQLASQVKLDKEIPLDYRAVSVPLAAVSLSTDYDASVVDGIGKLQKRISTVLTNCPNTWLLLAGYSQGADVVGDTMESYLTEQQKSRVLGLALIGDPRFQGIQSDIDRGTYNENLNGIYTHFRGAERLDSDPAKTLSLCTAHDPVCNWTAGNAARCAISSTCTHLKYVTTKFAGETYTKRAADFLAARYQSAMNPPSKNTHVLVYGDDDGLSDGTAGASGNIAAILAQAGYSVTNLAPQEALPADLSSYGQIWHVGALSAMSDADISALIGFTRSGGGLYLTGERPCCQALNDSDATILNSLVVSVGGIGIGDGNDHEDADEINLDAIPQTVTDQPCAAPSFAPDAPGALTNVADQNTLYRSLDGSALAGVWGSDAVVGGGRVAVVMDINWAESLDSETTCLTQNHGLFLSGNVSPPSPAAALANRVGVAQSAAAPVGSGQHEPMSEIISVTRAG